MGYENDRPFEDRRRTDADVREIRSDIKKLISETSATTTNIKNLLNSIEGLVGGMKEMNDHIHNSSMHHCEKNSKMLEELRQHYEELQLQQAELSGVKKGVTMSYKMVSAIVAGITAVVSFLIANADKIKGFFGV